jgi:hypothetical protein
MVEPQGEQSSKRKDLLLLSWLQLWRDIYNQGHHGKAGDDYEEDGVLLLLLAACAGQDSDMQSGTIVLRT